MSNTQNKNFSLLTQSEVDTLVKFLQGKKDEVDSSVLNQSSIDKLIELLRFDERGGNGIHWNSMEEMDGFLADRITVRQRESDVCEIIMSIDSRTGFLKLSVKNRTTGDTMEITPELLQRGDGDQWGKCIMPDYFDRIARALDVQYTTATYEMLCERYAECVFGDAKYKLPTIYMPNDAQIIQELL